MAKTKNPQSPLVPIFELDQRYPTKLTTRPSPQIQELLVRADRLRRQLRIVEQALLDLDYEHYSYITGVIKRGSER